MSSKPKIEEALREAIIAQPDVILDDKDVMDALIAANEKIMGGNIVDLRGMAMDRLETRLDRLEDTHRTVIAAAYENLSGTNQVQRAVLRLLEPMDFQSFLTSVSEDVADILRVDSVKIVLEADTQRSDPVLDAVGEVLCVQPEGFIKDYLLQGRGGATRHATLRPTFANAAEIYGSTSPQVASEACLQLDLGDGRLPALLLLGSTDAQMFGPHQGTDLLVFFAGVFERVMRRWLA